ncbi:MAG TPA: serine/threonine-protein kinase [Gemmatimonadales bacterium]|nr:serine/threonine-protein kinase [Gemmatimonadales bacterium]
MATTPVTSTPPPLATHDRVKAAVGARYRLDTLVASSRERVLYAAYDTVLNRPVSLRVNFYTDEAIRRWFLREAEALGQLDHPAIRHAYDAGVAGDVAFRVGNWIEGESLQEAVQRGPRPIPAVHSLARDLLSALEHAHAHGIIARRIVPAAVLLNLAGRGVVTELRFSSWTLPMIPPDERPSGLPFMAPEVRDGQVGDQASDVYTVGAILYYAITGVEPPLDCTTLKRPMELRPATPRAIERILLRALRPNPADRYLTASEMLEDFASDAGTFDNPALMVPAARTGATGFEDTGLYEKRLRRALGDDYELLSLLGAGGFGRVYRVRDLHLEREVALKVMHPHLTADPAVVERFRREAQLAARLNHPNIVDIYDIAGRSGLLWYTMELVDGPNVAQKVERDGPLPVDDLMRLLREALSALGHAHQQGLVHRDVKPENLLLERDGRLRITDFGLALALRGQGKFGGATSQSGTPQFASPEQLLGERVDQRTDLYSLGAVAYFALLGEPPFPGSTPEQVLARQTANRFPELQRRRPDVRLQLVEVLERALQSEAELRYPSAAEFQQALNRVTGLRHRSGEWTKQALRWWKSRP